MSPSPSRATSAATLPGQGPSTARVQPAPAPDDLADLGADPGDEVAPPALAHRNHGPVLHPGEPGGERGRVGEDHRLPPRPGLEAEQPLDLRRRHRKRQPGLRMPELQAVEAPQPALQLERAAAHLQPEVGGGQDDVAVKAGLQRPGAGAGGEDARLRPEPASEDPELEAVAVASRRRAGILRGSRPARHQRRPRAASAPPARPSPRPTKVAAVPDRPMASSQPGVSRRGMTR